MEWGVTIEGVLTIGAVGVVLANKLHGKLKNSQEYQVAVMRGKNLIAEHKPAIQTLYEQPRTVLDSVVVKAKGFFHQAFSEGKDIFERKSGKRQREIEPAGTKNGFENLSKRDKYLLASFSTSQKAREFVNRNPKLVTQRISHKNIELWGVYVWRHSN